MAAKLKRALKVFNSIEDFQEGEEWQEAVEALETVTSQVAGDPKGFDLTGDGERWEAAGGDEISEASEFPGVLYDKWVDVMGGAAESLEWEPAQWEALWKNLQKWGRSLARAGLDFGGNMAELQDIIETYASGAPKQRKRKAPAEEAPAAPAAVPEAAPVAAAPAPVPAAVPAAAAEEPEAKRAKGEGEEDGDEEGDE